MATGMHGDVLNELGRRIAAGDPRPGTILKLAQLEQDHSASRTVIREAIRVLENIGMVAARRRVGITVQPREHWDALDPSLIQWSLRGPLRHQQLESLMELRVAVEPMAASLAAERATVTQRAELLRLAEQLNDLGQQGLGQTEEYLGADIAFHGLLLTSSGNPLLAAMATPIAEELAGRTKLGLHPTVPAPGTLEQHLVLARAIASGDRKEAEAHSHAHLLGVWREIAEGNGP
ncbi:FadR/GntR family transcriptional regulator [Mycetocola miduiensis]|uniref:Transcriptional regulator, GntR family n=1 Tax=Mycetocola miduiensis TaxID=995034 RepID=A0A1I5C744_9MICO|nr:FCD domain-containing protein [Mycetocola miduiensis]SFN82845.1 transcriptional regulator, GntR family [Mycetocola miduiensis]